MKLYYDPITVNCRKVVAGLDLVGANYEDVHVGYFAGEHKNADFLAVNPNGELPALVDGDLSLWESNAILCYGADSIGGSSAYPSDPKTRADIHRWHLWESSKWFGSCYVYLVENVVKPMLDQTPDQAAIDAEAPNFHALAKILDDRLNGRQWLSADQPTLADIAVAAPMHLHAFQKLPLENYPNLTAWMSRVEALPCWEKSNPAPHIPPELLAKLM
jgi:glutathione S-transferase